MVSPVDPNVRLTSSSEGVSNDTLKVWLSELTHLSPQQVEHLMAQRAQQPLPNPRPTQPE